MDEFAPDDCKRLFYGVSPLSSQCADVSSIFDVLETDGSTPCFGFEEWMQAEEAAGTCVEYPVSHICSDLFEEELQEQLNCSIEYALLEGADEMLFHTQETNPVESDVRNPLQFPADSRHSRDLCPPSTSHASLESPEVAAISPASSFNITSDLQEIASSSTSITHPNLADLKNIIVKKPVLDEAVERLGGGKNGVQRLWGLIQFWLVHRNISSSIQLPFLSNIATNQAEPPPISTEQMLFQESANAQDLANNASSRVIDTVIDVAPTEPIIVTGEPVVLGMSATALASCEPVLVRSPNLWASTASLSAATTRAARKHRMARKRKYLSHQHARPASSSSRLGFATLQASESCHDSYQPGGCSFPYDRKGLKLERGLRLFLRKELKPSDVGSLGRIVLPKRESESYLPNLMSSEGVPISMEDTMSSQTWNFRYRFWPNNKSRIYLLENTGIVLSQFFSLNCVLRFQPFVSPAK
ncbi:hypothetical protein O6H91_03G095300 [Diphasiastrum complanatum]|uniref:Uncharacterized protein n=1 Tax=Diphasiastrum complanatum TaxID=34168 RepID=A0ACC2E9K4_DIPCM|nr:hypothetical protein O6H91_03G095300 [Diphasiastrum complanatum]